MSLLDEHLSEVKAGQLLRRELPMAEAYRVGLHVLYCGRCHDLLNRVDPDGFAAYRRGFKLPDKPSPLPPGETAESVETSFAEGLEVMHRIESLKLKIEGLPPARRRLLLGNLESVPLGAILGAIMRSCRELFHTSPNEALDLSSFGLELLEQRRTEVAEVLTLSFRASLLGLRGNALRIVGELRKAERLLRRAERLSREVADPYDQAWACRYLAYTLADSRRYTEALKLSKKAQELFGSVCDGKRLSETRFQEAKILADAGQVKESIRILSQLSETPLDEDSLVLCTKHQLARNFVSLGLGLRARKLLPDVLARARAVGGVTALRARILEGSVLELLGDSRGAERVFRQTRDGFGAEYPYDLAITTLHLMRVLVRQGLPGKAARLAGDLLPLLGSRVHSEATLALRLLNTSNIGTGKIEAVCQFLDRLQRDPSYSLKEAGLLPELT